MGPELMEDFLCPQRLSRNFGKVARDINRLHPGAVLHLSTKIEPSHERCHFNKAVTHCMEQEGQSLWRISLASFNMYSYLYSFLQVKGLNLWNM